MKVACPFCKPNQYAKRGEGCCNCDHTGMVSIGETFHFKTKQEAIDHNPEIGYNDLEANRKHGRPLNFDPFQIK